MKSTAYKFGTLALAMMAGTGAALAAAPSGEPIIFGVIGGTTGAYGNVGTQAQQGALLAQDKLMADGGIMGRPVQLDMVNDNGDGTLAGQLFRKFVSENAVAVVGSPDNGPVTAQLAARFKRLDVGIVDGGGLTVYPQGPDGPPNAWVYQSGGNSFAWGAAMANYALKHCPNGLAVLHDTTSYGMGGLAAIKQVYSKAGKTLALEQPITENWTTGATAQLMPEVTAVKQSGAGCVELWLSPPNSAAFVQDMHSAGEKFLVIGNSDTSSDNTYSNLAGASADGTISAYITTELHTSDLYKEFAAAYRKKFNAEPTQNVEMTYQAILTVAHVIEATKSTDQTVLRDAFEKLSGYEGILGEVSFSPAKHVSVTEKELTLVRFDGASKKWVEMPNEP